MIRSRPKSNPARVISGHRRASASPPGPAGARSSAGVCSAMNAPFSMKYMRSTSDRATLTDCSTTTKEVPSEAMRRMSSSSPPTTTGASPSESSSMSTTRGRWMRVLASTSICRSPPESVAAAWSRRSSRRGKMLKTASMESLSSPRSRPRACPWARRFSCTDREPNAACPTTVVSPSLTRRVAEVVVMSLPLRCTTPPEERCTPERTRSRVVLPTPFGPQTPTISPSPTRRSTSKRTCTGP